MLENKIFLRESFYYILTRLLYIYDSIKITNSNLY